MKRWTREKLTKRGVPKMLIPGLMLAMALGWQADKLLEAKNYYEIKAVFPKSAVAGGVIDGDNIYLENGQSVRLIGINAPERGKENFEEAKIYLEKLTKNQQVWLEYDRTQDDQFGRIMAWVWADCEKMPNFLPWNYMRLSYNKSRRGLTENPDGCKEGKLLNEEMVKAGLAEVLNYKGRGELKYEARLKE